MGKNKPNAYSIFVRDHFNRMKRNGEGVVYGALFSSLSSKWQSLPEEVRQRYKDRAKNCDSGGGGGGGGGGAFNSGPPRSSQHQQQPPQAPPPRDFQFSHTSTSNGVSSNDPIKIGEYETKVDVKQNSSPVKCNPDIKPHIEPKIEVKTEMNAERGVKRELDLDFYNDYQCKHGEQQHQNEEQPDKKQKNTQGYGVPNWRNIRNSAQPNEDRYFDHHLLVLRTKCNSIIQTRGDNLISMPLYTFSCNVLCKHKKDGVKPQYIPIEIGIYAYSIEKGALGKPFCVIIDAGPAPSNYWGDTSDHIEAHKIRVTQSGVYPAGARNDYYEIYKEMCKYTRAGERTILVPDIYNLEQVKSSIEWLYEKAVEQEKGDVPKPSSWTILPLVDFVTASYNHVYCSLLHYREPKFTLHYYLKVRLETSIWDYDIDLMCQYHRRDDNQTQWCARSCAIRAIKALELTLDEIYQNYKLAMEAKEKQQKAYMEAQQNSPFQPRAQKPPNLQPQPQQPGASSANQSKSESKPEPAPAPRAPAQQLHQPMYMPEEKEPPPLFEELEWEAEIRLRREEAWRRPPPPPPPQPEEDHCDYELPQAFRSDIMGPALAIEATPQMAQTPIANGQPQQEEAAAAEISERKKEILNQLDPRLRRQANAQA